MKEAVKRRKIDHVAIAYSRTLGFACGIESNDNRFFYCGCIPYPNPRKAPIPINEIFTIVLILVWPLAIAIIFVINRARETIVHKIITGGSGISTFSLTWAVVIFSILLFIYMLVHDGTVAATLLVSEINCHKSKEPFYDTQYYENTENCIIQPSSHNHLWIPRV